MLPQFLSTLTVDEMIHDLKTVRQVPLQDERGMMPADILVPLFPGADHPEVPVDTLITIPNLWEPPPCRVLGIDSMVICRVPPTTTVSRDGVKLDLPFLLANVIIVKSGDDAHVVVQWWLPGVSPVAKYGGGKKRNMIDVFSAWTPSSMLQIGDVLASNLPNIIVPFDDLLQVNVELTDNKLSYDVFDSLHADCGIDVSALRYSQTRAGETYRTHAQMTRI